MLLWHRVHHHSSWLLSMMSQKGNPFGKMSLVNRLLFHSLGVESPHVQRVIILQTMEMAGKGSQALLGI